MSNFGEFIHNLRLGHNLGLREAAILIGIKAPYLSRIEAGRDNPPSIDVIQKMAKAYKVDAEYIIDQAKDRAAKVYGEEMMDNPALYALFKTMRQWDESDVLDVLRKVYDGDNEEDRAKLAKIMQEMQKKKDEGAGPQLSRLTKEQEWLFSAAIRPRFLSKKVISQMADKILQEHNIFGANYKAPTPIELITEKQKGIRLRMDLPLENFRNGKPRQLGRSNWSVDGHREIHINDALATDNATDIRRLRFTVGHELFHCIEHLPLMTKRGPQVNALHRELLELDKDQNHKVYENVYVSQWVNASDKPRILSTDDHWREWQADYFAACILMPEWSVKEEFEKRIGVKSVCVKASLVRPTADQIVRETVFPDGVFEKTLYQLYDVSVRAMEIRLLDLKLVHS
jgi:transcriptional regulator with XRE-family HTH domain/Zn-dependent peptidase ImmA (M78 family)